MIVLPEAKHFSPPGGCYTWLTFSSFNERMRHLGLKLRSVQSEHQSMKKKKDNKECSWYLHEAEHPNYCHWLTTLQGRSFQGREECKSHWAFITVTHLLEGQDLVMTTEYSGIFTELAAYSCFWLTYDIFTQSDSAQCRSLYVNAVLAAVHRCVRPTAGTRTILSSHVFL